MHCSIHVHVYKRERTCVQKYKMANPYYGRGEMNSFNFFKNFYEYYKTCILLLRHSYIEGPSVTSFKILIYLEKRKHDEVNMYGLVR